MSIPEVQRLLQGGIGPRPIALVSTLATDGTPNLSPFSFFNVFGANPPVVAFSPSRRGKDGTLKDTYNNLLATRECVISAVTYDMVEQVSLASLEFAPEQDEFVRSGLTKVDSDCVRPFGVKESPYRMECKLLKIESFGEGGASANIAICEVVRFHVAEDIVSNSLIDPQKIDLVARMGGDFYCRASGDSVFEVTKPVGKNCLGYDKLPSFMLSSTVYTGNDLGAFANSEMIPSEQELAGVLNEALKNHPEKSVFTMGFVQRAFRRGALNDLVQALHLSEEVGTLSPGKRKTMYEKAASLALKQKNLTLAWALALHAGKI